MRIARCIITNTMRKCFCNQSGTLAAKCCLKSVVDHQGS